MPEDELVKALEVVDVVEQLLAQELGLRVADVGVLLHRQNVLLKIKNVLLKIRKYKMFS
jgi:hypothetical protein